MLGLTPEATVEGVRQVVKLKRKRHRPRAIDELKKYPQWVVYRVRVNGSKLEKRLEIADGSGRQASSTNSKHWCSYEEARAACDDDPRLAGIAFVLTKNDPFVVIDLDHCVVDGSPNRRAREIVERMASYTEVSPSGTGLHI